MTTQEKILLAILAIVQFTHIMDFMVMMPMSEIIMRLFKINPASFGLVVSAYNLSAFCACITSIFFLDRFDRKKALVFLYSGFILGTLACGVAQTFEMLLVARIIAGFFGGVLSALILSIVGDVFTNERRGRAMGAVMIGFSAAAVLGVPVGFYLANTFDWHIPFFIVAGVALLNLGVILKIMPTMTTHLANLQGSSLERLKGVFANANQRWALLLTVILVLGQFSVIPFITPYVTRNVGIDAKYVSLIYLFGGICTIFSMPLIGKLSDSKGKVPVFTVLALIAFIPLWALTNLPPVSLAVVIAVTCCFFVFVGGRMTPAMALVTTTTTFKDRGTFMSINAAMQQLASGLASLLAGLIVVELPNKKLLYYDWVGYLAISMGVLAIILVRKVRPAVQPTQVAKPQVEEVNL